MKRYALALCALMAAATPWASPFKDPLLQPAPVEATPAGQRMTAVAARQAQLVAVGPSGRILWSGDNGRQWTQATVPVSSDLVSVRFSDENTAWAVGHDGVILSSQDAGKTWTKRLDGIQAAKSMHAYYDDLAKRGIAVDPQLLADAKRAVEEGADKPFLDVLFLNDKEGFAVGAFNLSFRTRDGGRTWTPLQDRTNNPKGMHLYGLALSNGSLYVVGEQGLVRRWNPGKELFEAVELPSKSSLFGAVGRNSTLVAYGLGGTVFQTSDGGSSWAKLETRTTAGITSGAFLPDGRAVFTTATGALLLADPALASVTAIQPAKPMAYAGVVPAGGSNVALVGNAGVRIEPMKGPAKAE